MWLNAITRTGYDTTAGDTAAMTLPSVTFSSIKLQNRVDTTTIGRPAFHRHRIHQITTESGSVITADYDRTNPCTAPVTLTAATNTSSCYPVRWTPPTYTTPFTDWFNKYVVTTVLESDPTGHANKTTSYKYLGGPAWHYDENEVVKAKYRTYGQFRGYGKCRPGSATPPTTSKLIEPAGHRVVTEFFDVGTSRALPWKRRPRANELLAALKDPRRGFEAVVIGEPQRAFYGNQLGLTFPVFEHYDVQLWVPEVGGAVDPGSDAHELVMSLYGGMSKGECNRIKIRVRSAMAAKTPVLACSGFMNPSEGLPR